MRKLRLGSLHSHSHILYVPLSLSLSLTHTHTHTHHTHIYTHTHFLSLFSSVERKWKEKSISLKILHRNFGRELCLSCQTYEGICNNNNNSNSNYNHASCWSNAHNCAQLKLWEPNMFVVKYFVSDFFGWMKNTKIDKEVECAIKEMKLKMAGFFSKP